MATPRSTNAALTRRRFLGAGLATGSTLALGAALSPFLPAVGATAGGAVASRSGLVTPGSAWIARHGLDAASYQQAFDAAVAAGYRVIHVAGYDTPSGARYAAIWERTGGSAWQARHGLTAAQHQAAFDRLVREGYRLRGISCYTDAGQERYASIWERTGGPAWQARHGMTAAQHQATFDALASQGYRPRSVRACTVAGVVRYASIWEQTGGPAWQARHGLTAAQHQATFDELVGRGYRPVDLAGYATPAGPQFAAIYELRSGAGFDVRHGLTSTNYQEAVDTWALWGLRPMTVSGYQDGPGVRYVTAWLADGPASGSLLDLQGVIDRFLSRRGVGASQFAVANGGRLVYARAFGRAVPSAGEATTLTHRFRVASVSKPITAVAVHALVDAGRLGLDQQVFGAGAVLGTTYGTKPYGEHLRAITVRHLLTHTVGTWANDGNDPMFLDRSLSQADIIGRTLDDRPPAQAPGAAYAYSNFGYCVLGRVIEAASGQSYAAFTGSVLARAGVTRAAIGGNALADRQPAEVVYEGRDGEDPYGMNVARMDAHGGWIATAPDLVRFALSADGRPSRPDVLSAGAQAAMDMPSTVEPNYAQGWAVNGANRWHNGSLPGTSAILVRAGELTWAGLLNTRDASLVGDLDTMIWDAIGAVSRWPEGSLPGW